MTYQANKLLIANYKQWNQIETVTINEFIYLALGFKPIELGIDNIPYLPLENTQLSSRYKEYIRISEELPYEVNSGETLLSRELKYEALFLINWYKDRGFNVHEDYQPALTISKKKIEATKCLNFKETITKKEFANILGLFNNAYKPSEIEQYIISSVKSQTLTPINSSYDYRTEIEDRNYEFKTDDLIRWAGLKRLTLPTIPSNQEHKPNSPSCLDDQPDRTSSMLLMILAMVVKKYKHVPSAIRNTSTGVNPGSIKIDVDDFCNKNNLKSLSKNTIKTIVNESENEHLK